jgi:transposase-like protein
MERRINEKIKELEDRPEELYDYLARCAPHIRDYTTERAGGVQRKDIFDDYMSSVENTVTEHKKRPAVDADLTCHSCGKMYTLVFEQETSEQVCTECGAAQYVQSNERGFKEEQEMERNVVYSYKRDNHFNEWVSQFQAKESTSIPEEVINQLRVEFKKQKIKDSAEITHLKVRGLLKKLGLNKYYEHAPYITTILNGVKPPTMPQELEDKLRLMFGQVQKPFEKHCPADRKNFLSYSFTLYKFCELLGEDEYLPCFPLLKSKEKLHRQDEMWRLICRELAWEFIPTAT